MNLFLSLLVSVSHYFGPATEPTPAAPCACQQGGECKCGDDCNCAPAIKAEPVSVLALRPRIDELSPVTRAPLPPALEAELEAELAREHSVRRAPSSTPFVSNYNRQGAVPVQPTKPTYKAPPPVERAVMRQVMVGYQCNGGVCTPVYEWHPVSSQPTKVVQPAPKSTTSGRPGLFGRWRNR